MRSFLAVSAAPGAFLEPSPQVLECLTTDGSPIERLDLGSGMCIAFAGRDPDDMMAGPEGSFTASLSLLRRTRKNDLTIVDVAAMMSDPARFLGVLPPFAAVHRRDGPIVFVNDWLGYRQLFWWQGHDVAAVSTSARALAELAGSGFDRPGLGALAMIGWHIGDRTIFEGVSALPPASLVSLGRGAISIERYAEPLDHVERATALGEAVDEMAEILVEWHSRYLDDHPDSVLQLTGGHDSRILLGAVPPSRRAGLQTMTVGDADHPDVVIAAHLSKLYGMRHHVYALDEIVPTPAEAHALALSAARALECQASPVALAPLLLVESRLDQGHRLSGLGGEVARGFYYAGQPAGALTSARLIERLARWRIFANEAVEPRALDADFHAEALEHTMHSLVDLFPAGDWLRATDSFYLYQRMHRWSAAHGTVAAVRRHAVNPMLDHRFIQLALAVEPGEKRDSILLGQLMRRLDPQLARLPLESGLAPARLGARTAATRLAVALVTARKGMSKVRQRLTRGRRPQLGAAAAAELVLTHWRSSPTACEGLYDQPIVDRRWLDGLLAGSHPAEPTTIAFLVNLLAAAGPVP